MRVGGKRGPVGEETEGKCGELGWRGDGDHIVSGGGWMES